METVQQKCALCGGQATLQCSRCKKVHYCNTEHQKSDWKAHKAQCKGLYEIQCNKELGRHLIASSDIPANSEIFNEMPLILGPKFFGSLEDDEEMPLKCVGCFKTITGQAFSCPRCQWPACSPDCSGLDVSKSHGLECSVLAFGTRLHINEAMNNPNFFRLEAMLPLKCLLMQLKQPQKYAELMQMESHLEELKDTDLYRDFETRIVSYLNDNFLESLKKYDEKAEKPVFAKLEIKNTILKICGILETNAMCIRLDNKDELNGIYKSGCMLEHSCVPNCFFSFDQKNGFKLKVRAGRDIRKGEHLSICYTNTLWGTQIRQHQLKLTKCFTCKCERCMDPTELGTNFSTLKCLGAKDKCPGFQMAVNPTDPETDWVCSGEECDVRLTNHQVFEFMQNVERDVDSLMASDKTTVDQIQTAIEKLSGFLHPNHYHMFGLKQHLVQLLGFQPGYEYYQLTMEQLDDKLKMCQELLEVLKTLDKHFIRVSLYAATLAFEMHRTLFELKRRGLDRHSFVGSINETMEEMKLFGKLTLQKDLDVPEAKQLHERFNSL